MKLTLAFSPCPNDCFIFDAIVHRRIDLEGLEFSFRLADVEALNRAAFAGEAEVTKLSIHAFAHCQANYSLLDAGSALGRNCGPLVIAKSPLTVEELASGTPRVAIPGRYTTANFLLDFVFPGIHDRTELLFSDIESAVLAGAYDAGVIIHENRFTYEAKGLRKIVDLGECWEQRTGCPIPLGGIAAARSLPEDVIQALNRVVRRSVEYAFAHREASLPFVRAHAQEMSEEVMYKHIDLYVNEFTIDLGPTGRQTVELLVERVNSRASSPTNIFSPTSARPRHT